MKSGSGPVPDRFPGLLLLIVSVGRAVGNRTLLEDRDDGAKACDRGRQHAPVPEQSPGPAVENEA